jgi:hypothetical protein
MKKAALKKMIDRNVSLPDMVNQHALTTVSMREHRFFVAMSKRQV